jgi:hypothetical protein
LFLEYGEKIFGLNFNDKKNDNTEKIIKIYKIIFFKDKNYIYSDLDLDERIGQLKLQIKS